MKAGASGYVRYLEDDESGFEELIGLFESAVLRLFETYIPVYQGGKSDRICI